MTANIKTDASVTGLLIALQRGERDALDELFPLVYDELRALAQKQRMRWRGDLTMNATSLVHEAYLKLVDHKGAVPESRHHFNLIAARAMRHILCNYARDRARLKRGGASPHVSIDPATSDVLSAPAIEDLGALDDALDRLQRISERQARVVECRFFAGMSIEETAGALGISTATVKRDWAVARAWLFLEIGRRA